MTGPAAEDRPGTPSSPLARSALPRRGARERPVGTAPRLRRVPALPGRRDLRGRRELGPSARGLSPGSASRRDPIAVCLRRRAIVASCCFGAAGERRGVTSAGARLGGSSPGPKSGSQSSAGGSSVASASMTSAGSSGACAPMRLATLSLTPGLASTTPAATRSPSVVLRLERGDDHFEPGHRGVRGRKATKWATAPDGAEGAGAIPATRGGSDGARTRDLRRDSSRLHASSAVRSCSSSLTERPPRTAVRSVARFPLVDGAWGNRMGNSRPIILSTAKRRRPSARRLSSTPTPATVFARPKSRTLTPSAC